MDFVYPPQADTYRTKVRAFLDANLPKDWKGIGALNHKDAAAWTEDWREKLAKNDFLATTWPKEYGGAGLTAIESLVIAEEFALSGVPGGGPNDVFGIQMLGNTLLMFGTEEQKQHYLPRIIAGDDVWCQGYSEPNAGSDLASLQTKAIDKGGHFEITGSKVWTSYADKADWIFCLVRTDFDCPKHEGISFLLFDMASEGVSTKPIKLISGTSPFCETFFDNVQVPKGQLIGTLNKGWEIAKYLLTHEREMIGGFGLAGGGMKGMGQLAAAKRGTVEGRLRDTSLRAEAISFELDEMAFGLTIERITEETKAGQGAGASSSILKMYGTELNKLRQELFMAIGSSDALNFDTDEKGALVRNWLRSKANSIEGGTTEVQLNIIAKRILGLPA